MQDTISTNTESGPVTNGPTEQNQAEDNSVKTRLANMLINRVTLSECLNVIRDACVQRANQIIEKADEEAMKNIIADLEVFENPPKQEGDSESGGQSPEEPDLEPVEVVSS